MTTWDDFTAMVTAGVEPSETTQFTNEVLTLIQKSVRSAHRQPHAPSGLDGQTEPPAHTVTALWHRICPEGRAWKVAIPFMRLSPRAWQILCEADPTDERSPGRGGGVDDGSEQYGTSLSTSGSQVFDSENEMDLLSLFEEMPIDAPVPQSECSRALYGSSRGGSSGMKRYGDSSADDEDIIIDDNDAYDYGRGNDIDSNENDEARPRTRKGKTIERYRRRKKTRAQLRRVAELFATHVRNVADTLKLNFTDIDKNTNIGTDIDIDMSIDSTPSRDPMARVEMLTFEVPAELQSQQSQSDTGMMMTTEQWASVIASAGEVGGAPVRAAYRRTSVLHHLITSVTDTCFARAVLVDLVPRCGRVLGGATGGGEEEENMPRGRRTSSLSEEKRYEQFCRLVDAVSDAAQVDRMEARAVAQVMKRLCAIDDGIYGSAAQVIVAKKLFPH